MTLKMKKMGLLFAVAVLIMVGVMLTKSHAHKKPKDEYQPISKKFIYNYF